MSWYGSELTTVMFTSPGATPSSSIRRAAPRAAHRPANPEPSTTTSLTGLTLAARYPRYGARGLIGDSGDATGVVAVQRGTALTLLTRAKRLLDRLHQRWRLRTSCCAVSVASPPYPR